MDTFTMPHFLSFPRKRESSKHLKNTGFRGIAGLTVYKQVVYTLLVIQAFACKETEKLFQGIRSRKLPNEIQARAFIRLTQLNAASVVNDLKLPPSNRLEALTGRRKGQWSIRINEQWRICFKFDTNGAYDVEITDYH
jgi:proteic killer suppression protein